MRDVPGKQIRRSRKLRQKMTPSETALWSALRDRRYVQLKFRRQQPVGPFIVDFCCWEKKVIVELDGDSHAGKETCDITRQQWLEKAGWKVLRFWDSEFFENQVGVMQAIYNACAFEGSTPSLTPDSACAASRPSPGGRGQRQRLSSSAVKG